MLLRRCRFVLIPLVAAVILIGCGQADKNAALDDKKEDKKDDDVFVLPSSDKRPDTPIPPGQQTVTFLNSQGTGRHFCFIADCSLSLSPASFTFIRREVAKSIESLNDECRYYPIFFAREDVTMPDETWLHPRKDLERTKAWMDGLVRIYKTNAAPAFAKAFKLSPPPDVIFFMTDGQLTDAKKTADTLKAAPPKVVIHTILFRKTSDIVAETNADRRALEKIARDFGGTYKQFTDPGLVVEKKKKKKAAP